MTDSVGGGSEEVRLARIVADLRARGRAAMRVSYISLLAIAGVVAGGSWAFYGVHGVIEGENQESTARARGAVDGVVRAATLASASIDQSSADFKRGVDAKLSMLADPAADGTKARRTLPGLDEATVGTEQLEALVATAAAKTEAASAAAMGAASELEEVERQLQTLSRTAAELDRPRETSELRELRDLAAAQKTLAEKKDAALKAVQRHTSGADDVAVRKVIDDLARGKPVLRAAVMSRISYNSSLSDVVGPLDELLESGQSHLAASRAVEKLENTIRESHERAGAAFAELKRKKSVADAALVESVAERNKVSEQINAHLARVEQRETEIAQAAKAIAASNASRLSYERKKVDEMREILADIPTAPSAGISAKLEELKATLEKFPEDVKTVGATQRLVMTLLTRVAIGVLIFFLAQVLLGLYRYNARLAAHYLARADALEILGDKVLGTSKQERLESLIEKLSADTVDFGRMPKSPTQQVVDLTKAVLQSSAPRRPRAATIGEADEAG